MDKKREKDDEIDVSEGFDYAEIARCAAQAAIGPCDAGVFSERSQIRQIFRQRAVVLCSSNFSTQSTSSSDAIITDTAVVADADK